MRDVLYDYQCNELYWAFYQRLAPVILWKLAYLVGIQIRVPKCNFCPRLGPKSVSISEYAPREEFLQAPGGMRRIFVCYLQAVGGMPMRRRGMWYVTVTRVCHSHHTHDHELRHVSRACLSAMADASSH
jgi:hypothetical protein